MICVAGLCSAYQSSGPSYWRNLFLYGLQRYRGAVNCLRIRHCPIPTWDTAKTGDYINVLVKHSFSIPRSSKNSLWTERDVQLNSVRLFPFDGFDGTKFASYTAEFIQFIPDFIEISSLKRNSLKDHINMRYNRFLSVP